MSVDKDFQGSGKSTAEPGDSKEKPEADKTTPEELQQKAEWLSKKIDEAIEHTRRNKRGNRRRATYVKIATIVFAGIATILLGLQIGGFEAYFKGIAFVLGAIVTLLNALEPFFNFRALWVEHEAAQAKFFQLKDRLEFLMVGTEAEELTKETLYAINDEYGEIWTNLSETWIRYRREGQTVST